MEGQIRVFTHDDVVGLFGGIGTVDAEDLILVDHLEAGRKMVFLSNRIYQGLKELHIPVDILTDHGGLGHKIIAQFVEAAFPVTEEQLAFYQGVHDAPGSIDVQSGPFTDGGQGKTGRRRGEAVQDLHGPLDGLDGFL